MSDARKSIPPCPWPDRQNRVPPMPYDSTRIAFSDGRSLPLLGAQMKLLSLAWIYGAIDVEPKSLAFWLHTRPKRAAAIWDAVKWGWVQREDGFWTRPELEEERARAIARMARADRIRPARTISPQQRARVMERDGFRCRRCGAQPDETRLAVDHIVPVARGGGASAANLQTLCVDCNIGKGAREPHAHDLRPTELFG